MRTDRLVRLLFCLVVLCALPAAAQIPQTERDALLAFFNATNGPQWQEKAGWGGAAGTECGWNGVTCNEAGNSVVRLALYGNGLNGSIPPQIRDLKNLQFLILPDHRFASIPVEITELANLEELNLASSNMTGPIPPEIGRLAKLRRLELWNNRLTGGIPRQIGDLTQLEALDLSENPLGGTIPAEITRLARLRELYLIANSLGGPLPADLGSLTNLEKLYFGTNRLTGGIPSSIGSLAKLTDLDLSDNQLGGPLPDALGQLRALQYLWLGSNAFSGPIPSMLGNLSELRLLSLTQSGVSGAIPSELGNLTRLGDLLLDYNALTGTLPDDLQRLRSLVSFRANNNQLRGPLPTWLGGLTALDLLDLSANQFEGPIPANISALTALTYLSLGYNQLTGVVPTNLSALTKLEYLDLAVNLLGGTIPPSLGSLTNLTVLSLGGNQLTGAIPNELSKLTRLRSLDIYGNRLTGGLPSWIGQLTDLESIQAGGNELGGPIPDEFTRLTKLTYVDLGGNLHTGQLPRDFTNLKDLIYLYLYSNLLEGPVPDLTRFRNLQVLSLEGNRFSGPLPSVEGLDDLVYISVADNSLSGDLPASLFTRRKLETVAISFNRFAGPFPIGLTRLPALTDFYIGYNNFRGPLPRELMSMTRLTSLDLSYNALFTTDAALRAFVDGKQGSAFEESQTLAPSEVAVSEVTDRSAVVSWKSIFYEWDEGGYELTVTPSGGGAPIVVVTPYKYVSSTVVRGLSASTSYTVSLRTVTYPHDYQRNVVSSDATAAIPFATGPRVQAPPIVDLAVPPEGLVQVNGAAVNRDSYVLTNYGDSETVVTLDKSDDSFDHAPATFTLRGGESQTIQLTAKSLPFGAYEFYSVPTGNGVVKDLYVPVRILSVRRPAGTAVAQPGQTRVEVVGERGTDTIATVSYANVGNVELSGILVSDVGWIAAPRDLITIAPGETRNINFTVQRSKRPDASATGGGALSGNLNLLYVDGSASAEGLLSAGALTSHGSGLAVSTVTVVDTSKPPVTQSAIPPLGVGEVARLIPGVTSAATTFARSVTDVAVSNSFGAASVNDLRLYYASANALSASVATMSDVGPSKSVSLANVVSNVYNSSGSGTVHVRSQRWSSLLASARLLNIRTDGSFGGSAPVFRSDRSVAPAATMFLVGLMGGSQHQAAIVIQETAGSAAAASIEFLDAAGNALSRVDGVSVPAFGMAEVTDSIPSAAAVAVVTNRATIAGARLVAYARVTDRATGDVWSVVDWSRYYDFDANAPVRIPIAQASSASTGSGRRRAASHNGAGSVSTDLLIHNRNASNAAALVQFIDANGSMTERQVQLAPRQTLLIPNVVASLFGRTNATGSIVVTPLRAAPLAVSARTHSPFQSGAIGTAVPVIPAASGLRRGQFDVYSGIEESTLAAATLKLPGTSRTRFGIVETSGSPVKVRVSMLVHDGRSIVSALVTRDYTVGAREMLLVDNMSTSIIGSNRDAMFGALHNLQLRFEVIEGDGSAAVFVGNVDNQSGDESLRFE